MIEWLSERAVKQKMSDDLDLLEQEEVISNLLMLIRKKIILQFSFNGLKSFPTLPWNIFCYTSPTLFCSVTPLLAGFKASVVPQDRSNRPFKNLISKGIKHTNFPLKVSYLSTSNDAIGEQTGMCFMDISDLKAFSLNQTLGTKFREWYHPETISRGMA